MSVPTQTDSAAEETANVNFKDTALRAYRSQQKESDHHQRIVAYLPLVHKLVHQVAGYLRPSLSIDDLVSAGTIGLVKAARDFDPTKDAEFKTYAYIRIRGAVIDELRNWSFAPPALGKQMNAIDQFCRDTIEQSGLAPSDEQIAEHLGVTVEKLYRTFEHARAGHFLSIHGLSEETPSLGNFLVTKSEDGPHANSERSELLERLTAAIQQLPKKQRQITILYYNQQLTMKQIAQAMDITESRVSQLHATALVKLSAQLGADMTAENNFNVKPLTNVPYVTPANPSGEQPARKQRPYKRKSAAPQTEDPTQTADDDGEDMRHVIDYRA